MPAGVLSARNVRSSEGENSKLFAPAFPPRRFPVREACEREGEGIGMGSDWSYRVFSYGSRASRGISWRGGCGLFAAARKDIDPSAVEERTKTRFRNQLRWESGTALAPGAGQSDTGVRVTTDEDDLPPRTPSDVRKRYAGTSFPEQYEIIWNRFLLRAWDTTELTNQP